MAETRQAGLAERERPRAGMGEMVRVLVRHRDLIWQMAKREVVGRYKGSALGLLWSFFYPLLMLAAYTFAFSYVFKVKPSAGMTAPRTSGDLADFALYAFSGLVLFTLFTEVVTRAPLFILQNANYVKKVVFPLEIFPYVYLAASLIHAVISTVVLLLASLAATHTLPWTILFMPLVVVPLSLMILGAGWFLAALGVYLRDVAHTVGIVAMMLMYLSPVFYSVDRIDNQTLRTIIRLNPLTIPLEAFRWTLGRGSLPGPEWIAGYCAASLLIAWIGFFFFQKTKRGFADVI